ncbi:MAG: HAMP domain-containing protein, partial [Magnetospirillum sp.]|nr:HAMP domain-containing protein [Magnetospirillum sp.]
MFGLSIRLRLYAGFGIVLAILAGIVGLSAMQTETADDGIHRVAATGDVAMDALQVDRDLIALRREVREYSLSPSLQRRATVETARSLLSRHISGLDQHEHDDPNMAALRDSFAAYSKGLDELLDVAAASADATARLDATIRNAQRLAGLGEAGLTVQLNLLEARLAGEHFFESNDEADFQEAEAGFRTALAAARPLGAATEAEILAAQTLFGTLAQNANHTNRLIPQMVTLGNQTGAAATLMREHNEQAAAETVTAASNSIDHMRDISLIAALAAILLALTMAGTLARSIVRPLKQMTVAMGDLARGNLFVDIPAWRRRDEIGAMSTAMAVFKENALGLEKMRQEQEAAKLKAQEERTRTLAEMARIFERGVSSVLSDVGAATSQLRGAAQ